MKPYIKYRVQNDREMDEQVGEATATVNEEPTLTQQQFQEDADINVIVRRFGLDKGPVPPAALDPAYYGDLSDVPDLRTALDLVRDATNRFMELPAALRSRFHNKPGELWEFVNDPDNAQEAVRLGLLAAPPTETVAGQGVTGTAPSGGEAGGTAIS